MLHTNSSWTGVFMGPSVILLIFLILIVLLLGILIGLWLSRVLKRRHPEPPPPPPPPPPPGGYKIPDKLGETDLATALNVRLAGTAANGVPASLGASGPTPASAKVVWVDHGNEVLVHLDSTVVRILDRMVLVSVDLETDQTGRTPLICSFAVSGVGELGGLVATTDDLPRGSGVLASCWGKQLQAAVWSSLIGLANDHAAERDLTPRALSAVPGSLSLAAGSALTSVSTSGGAA
jgi:hypothetical protein